MQNFDFRKTFLVETFYRVPSTIVSCSIVWIRDTRLLIVVHDTAHDRMPFFEKNRIVGYRGRAGYALDTRWIGLRDVTQPYSSTVKSHSLYIHWDIYTEQNQFTKLQQK